MKLINKQRKLQNIFVKENIPRMFSNLQNKNYEPIFEIHIQISIQWQEKSEHIHWYYIKRVFLRKQKLFAGFFIKLLINCLGSNALVDPDLKIVNSSKADYLFVVVVSIIHFSKKNLKHFNFCSKRRNFCRASDKQMSISIAQKI